MGRKAAKQSEQPTGSKRKCADAGQAGVKRSKTVAEKVADPRHAKRQANLDAAVALNDAVGKKLDIEPLKTSRPQPSKAVIEERFSVHI